MSKPSSTTNAEPKQDAQGEPAAVWTAISDLKPWDQNPRKNDAAAKLVMKSIKRWGFGAPIIARLADKEVIGGHTRLKAAEMLGMKQVPVRFLDLDPAEAHLLALADNKLGEKADWDDAQLASILSNYGLDDAADAGFDKDELDKLGTDLGADDQSGVLKSDFSVLINCDNEEQQLEVIEQCQQKGWTCRALV